MREIPANRLTRFSDRVEDYVKYRPDYPPAVGQFLIQGGLRENDVVADVGSGTGIFTRQLLDAGHEVLAIEPNTEMRAAAEKILAVYPRFRSITGTAESTTLAPHSVNFITSAQAFHWFQPEASRREFRRILKAGGKIALIWNSRRTDTSPFLIGYERILKTHAPDYERVRHQGLVDRGEVEAFFEGAPLMKFRCPHRQLFDFEGLKGRLRSSSYVPQPPHPRYETILGELREIFETYQAGGKVSFDYDTEVTVGALP